MKKLWKLNFGISVDELAQFLDTNSHEGDFPYLRELKIDIEKLSIVGRLLKRFGFKRLRSLTVLQSYLDEDSEDSESEWDLEAFFKALNSSQGSHSELRSLNIVNYPSVNGPSEHVLPFTSTALGFILPFSSLFVLKITFRVSIMWTDADLEAIAHAWPMLHKLSLECEQECVPSITLKGLIQLLRGCRELQRLMIRVDARQPPIFAESGDLGVIAPKLRHLDMYTSPLDNPDEFSTLIMIAFPALADLCCTGYDDNYNINAGFPPHHPHQRYAKAWNMVISRLIPVLERRWISTCLARTCRAFSEPALDELWRVQPSLLYLLQCLPGDAYEVRSREERSFLTMTRELHANDCKRIRIYAPRIKSIVRAAGDLAELDTLVIPILWASRAIFGGTLLPNLRHLSVNVEEFWGQALLPRLLVKPKIIAITIQGPAPEGDERPLPWDNLTAIIKPIASSLISFTLTGSESTDDQYQIPRYPRMHAFMDLHQSFHHLVDLDSHNVDITHTVLSHLASLKKLRKLDFAISVSELVEFLATPPRDGDFPSLVNLKIDIVQLSIVRKLLERPGFKRLQILTVLQSAESLVESEWDLEEFFKAVNSSQDSHSDLRSLSILNYPSIDSPSDEILPFTSTALGFLLPFSSLIVLEITFRVAIMWTDIDLESITSAWPMLDTLFLEDEEESDPPSITLKGLIQLFYGCRELRKVMIRVDARQVPMFVESGDLGTIAPKLQYLDMSSSPLENPDEFSSLIMISFPSLKKIYCSTYYQNDYLLLEPLSEDNLDRIYAEAWNKVTSQLRPLLDSR
ncbi:hypothetical protein H0H81_004213 [Sphagnurus paluster]|uniref:Uncharacterized protein n=1 Tax=Sphagnurus paluster TaxID=117069 RepID=A0A9P7GT36_9AGAR|nr:hypothetical protein H0H81_004213 [Sphagnurus paluster]